MFSFHFSMYKVTITLLTHHIKCHSSVSVLQCIRVQGSFLLVPLFVLEGDRVVASLLSSLPGPTSSLLKQDSQKATETLSLRHAAPAAQLQTHSSALWAPYYDCGDRREKHLWRCVSVQGSGKMEAFAFSMFVSRADAAFQGGLV